MAEVGLDETNIDTGLDEVRAARVTQGVGKNAGPVIQETGSPRSDVDDSPDLGSADPPAAGREKHRIRVEA